MHRHFLVSILAAATVFEAACTEIGSAVVRAGTHSNHVTQVKEPWHGTHHRDLHREYNNIFKHGNRNAASHLWSKFLLERSEQMSHERLLEMFTGYCAVSGSPVRPSDYTRYRLTLDRVDGRGKTSGFMYYCCWPCVCDTQDFIKVDTRNVTTADGTRTYRFAVLGNPCDKPEALKQPFNQHGRTITLHESAAEVRCDGNTLINAPLSDHGYVIIGMFFDAPGQSSANDWQNTLPAPLSQAHPGRLMNVAGTQYQDEAEFGPMCDDRAARGYNSGMGEIFRKVGSISPIQVPSSTIVHAALPDPSSQCENGDCKSHTNEL